MKVYIPSYLGKDPKTIEKRQRQHLAQVQWILDCPAVEKIVICSQGYPPNCKVQDARIEYVDSEPLGPSHARNILLAQHYQSGDKTCLFIDNDISSKKHTLSQIIELATRLTAKTTWNLLGFVPHGFGLLSKPPAIITFTRKSVFASGMFFLQDVTDVYFDESIHHMEDVDFMFRLMMGGHSYYEITQYEFFEHSYAASVIYEDGNRKDAYKEMRDYLKAHHKKEVQSRGYTSVKAYIDSRIWPKHVVLPLNPLDEKPLF